MKNNTNRTLAEKQIAFDRNRTNKLAKNSGYICLSGATAIVPFAFAARILAELTSEMLPPISFLCSLLFWVLVFATLVCLFYAVWGLGK